MDDGYRNVSQEDTVIHGVKAILDPTELASIESDLSSLEYIAHVSIIFIETLMNKKRKITSSNIDEIKGTLIESMTYFEW
jgi:hypothetical protein